MCELEVSQSTFAIFNVCIFVRISVLKKALIHKFTSRTEFLPAWVVDDSTGLSAEDVDDLTRPLRADLRVEQSWADELRQRLKEQEQKQVSEVNVSLFSFHFCTVVNFCLSVLKMALIHEST